jgi:perosamine synthetase
MGLLQEQGIASRPGTHAVHLLGLYRQRFGYTPDSCPQAAACDANTMAIPLHNRMDADDYRRVADALRAIR